MTASVVRFGSCPVAATWSTSSAWSSIHLFSEGATARRVWPLLRPSRGKSVAYPSPLSRVLLDCCGTRHPRRCATLCFREGDDHAATCHRHCARNRHTAYAEVESVPSRPRLRVFCHDLGCACSVTASGLRMFRHDLGVRMFRHDLGLRLRRACSSTGLGLRVFLSRPRAAPLAGASDHFVRLAVVVVHHVQQILRGLRHGVGLPFWGVSRCVPYAVHEALPSSGYISFELCICSSSQTAVHGSIDGFPAFGSLFNTL